MPSIFQTSVLQLRGNDTRQSLDELAVEEPLEIILLHGIQDNSQTLAVTMRTPGHDHELALGFLFSEGIIQHRHQVQDISTKGNQITLRLAQEVVLNTEQLIRYGYTTSSCGVCGKTSLDGLRVLSANALPAAKPLITLATLYGLPNQLRQVQTLFEITGGVHASGVFDSQGRVRYLREDVGRHNALDKVIGQALLNDEVPLHEAILLVSGRVSFELVQKALVAGIPLLAAIGAPSSLAVSLAEQYGLTLVGFLRDQQATIYTHPERVVY
jgi:FdhD protein